PELPAHGVVHTVRRLRCGPVGIRRRRRPRAPADAVPTAGAGAAAGEQPERRVVAPVAATVPGADPPQPLVVPVILRRVLRRGTAVDHPGICREPTALLLTGGYAGRTNRDRLPPA